MVLDHSRLLSARMDGIVRYDGKDVSEECLTTLEVVAEGRGLTARQRSILLVLTCTLFGAAAQMLIKSGANQLPHVSGVVPNLIAMATSAKLLAGYSLYGISTILLVV